MSGQPGFVSGGSPAEPPVWLAPLAPPFPIPAVPPRPALVPPEPPTEAPPDGAAPSAPPPPSPSPTYFDCPPQLRETKNDASAPNPAARRHERRSTTREDGIPDGIITIPPRIECDLAPRKRART